jgi:hypothetical protein
MNTIPTSLNASPSTYGTAFEQAVSPEVLQASVPAAFAPSAHERLSASYGFVPTAQVLDALGQADSARSKHVRPGPESQAPSMRGTSSGCAAAWRRLTSGMRPPS